MENSIHTVRVDFQKLNHFDFSLLLQGMRAIPGNYPNQCRCGRAWFRLRLRDIMLFAH